MPELPTLELLQTRRSVSAAFLDVPGPTPEELATLITIAMRVPDHGKLAPWRFIALDKQARSALARQLKARREVVDPDVPAEKAEKDIAVFQQAPLCLVVVSTASDHPKIPLWEQHLSAGASTMNLMIAAHAMGYAAQWLTGWATYDEGAKVLFGVAESEQIVGFIHIGTPVAPPSERPRPALEDHLTHGTG